MLGQPTQVATPRFIEAQPESQPPNPGSLSRPAGRERAGERVGETKPPAGKNPGKKRWPALFHVKHQNPGKPAVCKTEAPEKLTYTQPFHRDPFETPFPMFGVADYGAFVVTVIIFLLIPGPGNLALITSTSKGGVRGGLAATLGVILGDQCLMWAAVAGVAALLIAYPTAFHALQWAGALYLAWLGLMMLLAKPGCRPHAPDQDRPLSAPGHGHHPAQSQGHHVLPGLLSALRRPGPRIRDCSPSASWP